MKSYELPMSPALRHVRNVAAFILVLIVVLLLAGCGPAKFEDRTSAWKLPNDLSHCKMYYLKDDDSTRINVVHCPNSTTTTEEAVRRGKSGTEHRTTVVIDNQTYELRKVTE
jgi:hypothetical protein